MRNDKDFYPTPNPAIMALLNNYELKPGWILEPCAGNGAITQRAGKDGQVSYRIRVFVGETKDGKQKFKSLTWTPTPGMTAKQVEKELTRQATLFEEKVHQGLVSMDGKR